VTEVFKVHPQCIWHGFTVKRLVVAKWKTNQFKNECLLVQKEIKIKIH